MVPRVNQGRNVGLDYKEFSEERRYEARRSEEEG